VGIREIIKRDRGVGKVSHLHRGTDVWVRLVICLEEKCVGKVSHLPSA
jgi:hypothetical protein